MIGSKIKLEGVPVDLHKDILLYDYKVNTSFSSTNLNIIVSRVEISIYMFMVKSEPWNKDVKKWN